MNIADLVALLQSGKDPNEAVIQASSPGVGDASPAQAMAMMPGLTPGGPGPGATPPANFPPPGGPPAPPPKPSAPEGATTPVTNPQPAPESPKAYQSPPDLANMYVQLMKDNRNAAQLDSGLSLIAAGLSNNLATRQSLIGLAGHGGGSGAGSHITSADIINLQKHQQATKDMLLRRSMLGSLAKQYNLSPEAATALETSGKLDEVIQEHSKGHLQSSTDQATGQTILSHPITGKVVATLGGQKPSATQVVEGPQGPELRVTDPREGFRQVGASAGLKPTDEQRTLADINKERPPDQQMSMVDYITSIKRAAPNATNEAILATINKGRPADKQMGMEDLVKLLHPGQNTNLYVGADGTPHPVPQPGHDYVRGPDGKVLIDPETKLPTQVPINVKTTLANKDTEADIAKKEEALHKNLEADVGKARAKYATVSSVMAAAETAEKLIRGQKTYWPSTGAFSSIPTMFGSSGATDVRSAISTITANAAFSQLQQMRDASSQGSAGLGSVTDFEQKMLAATFASLDPYQSDAQLIKNLNRIRASMTVLAENDFKKGGKMNDAQAAASYQQALDKELAKYDSTVPTKKGTARRISD